MDKLPQGSGCVTSPGHRARDHPLRTSADQHLRAGPHRRPGRDDIIHEKDCCVLQHERRPLPERKCARDILACAPRLFEHRLRRRVNSVRITVFGIDGTASHRCHPAADVLALIVSPLPSSWTRWSGTGTMPAMCTPASSFSSRAPPAVLPAGCREMSSRRTSTDGRASAAVRPSRNSMRRQASESVPSEAQPGSRVRG